MLGKTIENPINKVHVKIVTNRKQYLKWLFRTTFKKGKFCNEAIAIEKKKHKINFNKTIHIRVSILDLSKVLM